MAKAKNNKKETKTSKKPTTTVSKTENRNFMLIVLGIILALLIVSYFIMGLTLTIVLGVGILIILGVARILDKIKNKPKQRKIFNIILIIFLTIALLCCGLVIAFFAYIVYEAPEFNIEELNKREASIVYDKDGIEYARIGSELRENVTYDDLPEVFIDALIATEDSRFFQHNGFDAPRFVKASVQQLLGNKNAGGASTLSMQVVKNTYTDATLDSGIKGIIRKFTDIYLAVFKLEKDFTKEEIIEFYVNNHELGSNSFGVEQASQTYFGKSVSDLNLSEASLLVGIFNAPTAYSPIYHPDKAYERRKTVLSLMVRHGYITQAEADAANAIPVTSLLKEQDKQGAAYASYIDTVIEELQEVHGINPYTTPVEIYTNMDSEKQRAIDDIFNGVTYKWKDDKVQSGVAVIDVDTGKIVAVGGGRFKSSPQTTMNYATQAEKQIGSAAKPIFDYGPAIEYNNWSTYIQLEDAPYTYSDGTSINNSDRKYMGWISLRTALAESRNIPALKAFQSVDNQKIIEFARNLGIEPDVQNGKIYEAHSLGAFDGTTPMMMAAAYAAFANGGTYYQPLSVNKVVYRDNGDVVNFQSESRRAMSDSTAFMITDVLVTSAETGLSSGAKVKGVNMAAKTGTSSYTDEEKERYGFPADAVKDAWVVGYDPEYAISLWYGYEDAKQGYNTNIQAVNGRSSLFKAIGNAVFNKNGQDFKVPDSVVRVPIEIGSSNPGALASSNTPADQITYEYYKKGTEPTETSSKYNRLDTPTGLKVTYSESKQQISITWNKQTTPTGNDSYGPFGYNVYYGNVLLGFTTENSYTIDANTNISGTYRVVATFQNYSANQSEAAVYEFKYEPSGGGNTGDNEGDNNGEEEGSDTVDESKIIISINGTNPQTISATSIYTDVSNPVTIRENGDVISTSQYTVKSTYKDPSGKVITSISGSIENPLASGTYTITYTITYKGKTLKKTATRQVIVP